MVKLIKMGGKCVVLSFTFTAAYGLVINRSLNGMSSFLNADYSDGASTQIKSNIPRLYLQLILLVLSAHGTWARIIK
jgi:hypothetical protein